MPELLWTVVEWLGEGAELATLWGASYGVCPNCAHRAPLLLPEAEARCWKCGGTFGVEWPASQTARGADRKP